MYLSIIIPLYNEECLVTKVLDKLVELKYPEFVTEFEILVIDDCSCDDSFNRVQEYSNSKSNLNIQCFRHEINLGKGAAARTEILHAKGNVFLIQDSDLELSPSDIPRMLEEIASNRFRQDLYHRISVIVLTVPSLNERIDDIPLLADYFVNVICNEYGVPLKTIVPAAVKELQKITWTGNIREFRNVMERLIILCDKEIGAKDVISFAQPLNKE